MSAFCSLPACPDVEVSWHIHDEDIPSYPGPLRPCTPQELRDGDPANHCGTRPSPRSSARCEIPTRIRHDRHIGRTSSGRWKFWGAE